MWSQILPYSDIKFTISLCFTSVFSQNRRDFGESLGKAGVGKHWFGYCVAEFLEV